MVSMKQLSGKIVPVALLVMAPSLACTQEADPVVRGYLSGVVTVSAALDSTGDYSGIEIIVTDGVQDGPDTLGYAVTGEDGSFATYIVADERGVYPLIMKRRGAVLSVNEFVVVDGDTALLRAELPLGQRLPSIRSRENSAWTAFKNAEAQHSSRVVEMMRSGQASQESFRRAIELGAEVLWSIRGSFPGTMGAGVASAKSVVMLDGWNDSLLVARMHELDPAQPGFLEGVQAAGRAETRLRGLDSGIALLRSKRTAAAQNEAKAGIQREIALAYIDARERTLALQAVDSLTLQYTDSAWGAWAERARYEIENLFPGDPAPKLDLATRHGGRVNLDSLHGRPVVVEFWSPRDREHTAQLTAISSLLANDSSGVQWVSVGLEFDEDLYDAFFEGRDVPGVQIHDERSLMDDLIVRYNVETVPTRYLIDPEGRIYEKYVGASLGRLARDLQQFAKTDG